MNNLWWRDVIGKKQRHSFIHIRLLIITMTERIMYSERHAEYNITTKRTTNDKECQYTCLYNTRLLNYEVSINTASRVLGSHPSLYLRLTVIIR